MNREGISRNIIENIKSVRWNAGRSLNLIYDVLPVGLMASAELLPQGRCVNLASLRAVGAGRGAPKSVAATFSLQS